MKKIHLFLFFITLTILSSCVERNIIDEIQLVRSASFDYTSDKKIEGTASITVHKFQGDIESTTISATASSTKDVGLLLNTESPKPIHTGKLNTLLLSEELAKEEKVLEVLDTFTRDPSVGRRIYPAITSGKAKDLYHVKKTLEKDIALDIQEMIEQNIDRQNIPESNFHLYLKQTFQIGQTPYLPYLTELKDLVKIDGVALLKDDRFVHKINLEESFLLKLLVEKFSKGTYRLTLEGDDNAVIRNIRSKSKFKIEKQTNSPNILITINLKGTINEYTGLKLTEEKNAEIGNIMEKALKKDIKKLIKTFQEKEVDPIGIGARVKAANTNFNEEEWNEYYKQANVEVEANVNIVGSGISQ